MSNEAVKIASTTDSQADLLKAAGRDARPTENSEQAKPPESQQAEPERNGGPKSSYQRRVDKLTREKFEFKRQADELKARLSKLEQSTNGHQPQAQEQPQMQAEPEAYSTGAEQEPQRVEPEAERLETPAQPEPADAELQEKFHNYRRNVDAEFRGDEAALEVPLNLSSAQADAARAALMDSENAGKVLRYMAQNPQFLDKIRQMSPTALHASMLKLSGRLLATQQKFVPPSSTAPAPIRPVGGSSTRSSVPDDELSYQDYAARRNSPQAVRERQRKGYGI